MRVKEISKEYLGNSKQSLKRNKQNDDTDFPEIFDKALEGRHHESKDNGKTIRYK